MSGRSSPTFLPMHVGLDGVVGQVGQADVGVGPGDRRAGVSLATFLSTLLPSGVLDDGELALGVDPAARRRRRRAPSRSPGCTAARGATRTRASAGQLADLGLDVALLARQRLGRRSACRRRRSRRRRAGGGGLGAGRRRRRPASDQLGRSTSLAGSGRSRRRARTLNVDAVARLQRRRRRGRPAGAPACRRLGGGFARRRRDRVGRRLASFLPMQ